MTTAARIYDVPAGATGAGPAAGIGRTMNGAPVGALPAGQATAAAPPKMPPIDELTMAKLRLAALHRPPVDRTAAIRQRPWPFVAGALATGFLLGRSRMARGVAAAALSWGVRRAVASNMKRLRG